PVPYFFGGFPADFPKTLESLAQIDAQTIVPGHGEILHDKTYIHLLADLQTAVNQEVEKEINDGLTVEEVQEKLHQAFDVKTWSQKFAGNDQEDNDAFDGTFSALVKASYNQIKAR